MPRYEESEWGVSVERNHGPLSEDGIEYLRDDWSEPCTYVAESKREAMGWVSNYRRDAASYRNARLVHRAVTAWGDPPQ